MALLETEESARRLARAIATDLKLYNAEKLRAGDPNSVLAAEIAEGRALYESRVAPSLRHLFDDAIREILVTTQVGAASAVAAASPRVPPPGPSEEQSVGARPQGSIAGVAGLAVVLVVAVAVLVMLLQR